MSFIAMCPAPFQKPSKKKGKKQRVPRRTADSVAPIIDQLVSTNISQQLDEPIVRKLPPGSEQYEHSSCMTNGYCHQQRGTGGPAPCSHCENDSQQSAGSTESRSTHTSGYQTDDGTFEGKMLSHSSRSRPANLRMTAIRDYVPCCHEELSVRRGQRVKVLYKNNDWVYAAAKSGETGYLPYSFVRPSRKYAGYQSEPEYMAETDVYQSGYDTDFPTTSRRHIGHKTQIGDVVPTYSIHQGFHGNGSLEFHHHGYGPPPHVGRGQRGYASYNSKPHLLSGYTSAVEYPISSDSRHQPRPAKSLHCIVDEDLIGKEHRPTERKPDSFSTTFLEELVVIHDFEAKEEDEVFIGKGERVKVMNADDPFWLWVETTPGDQGFVPRSCCSLGNHPYLQSNAVRSRGSVSRPAARPARRHYNDRSRAQLAARQARTQAKQRFHELARLRSNPQNPVLMEKEEIQRVGSKLIVLMDYTATQDDELSIAFAQTIYADVLKQAGAERIWAYCPISDKCGFVPVSLVVPPVV